jgi:hypothetical protein
MHHGDMSDALHLDSAKHERYVPNMPRGADIMGDTRRNEIRIRRECDAHIESKECGMYLAIYEVLWPLYWWGNSSS